jgi:autotransporter-associated beta strand protein
MGALDVGLNSTAGYLQLATASGTSVLASVSIGAGSVLDLNGNSLTAGGLSGSGVLDNVSAGGAELLTVNGTGSSTFSGNIKDTSGIVSLTLTAGTLTLSGANSYVGTTTISGGNLIIAASGGLPSGGAVLDNSVLTILAGTSGSPVVLGNISETTVAASPVNTGTGQLYIGNASTAAYVQLHTNSHTSVVSGLTLGAGSTLDISNNTVSIQFGSAADPITSIVAALSAAYAGGYWTGAAGASGAITSSTAAANFAANASPVLSIGYSDGNYDPTLAANAAASATAGQILIKMTLAGDAYLSGSVNFNDLDVLGRHYNTTGNDWAQGNFNYAASGAVNFNDLDIIGLNYNQNIGSLGSSGIESGGSTLALGLNSGSDEIGGSDSSPVAESVSVTTQTTIVTPEPGTLCILAAGAGGLLARRRRRTTK